MFEIELVCFIVSKFDLVHDVEARPVFGNLFKNMLIEKLQFFLLFFGFSLTYPFKTISLISRRANR